jgi:transposase
MVSKGSKIRSAAKALKIKDSTAKMIIRRYRQQVMDTN